VSLHRDSDMVSLHGVMVSLNGTTVSLCCTIVLLHLIYSGP
jgi:hypothetical protein